MCLQAHYCSVLAEIIRMLWEEHFGVKILSGMFQNQNHFEFQTDTGYKGVGLKGLKRDGICPHGARDLRFEATTNRGVLSTKTKQILPISAGGITAKHSGANHLL